LIWVPNQTGYITARDLDAATASHIKQYIQQQQQHSQQQQQQEGDGQESLQGQEHQYQQKAAATAAAGGGSWQLVPYGVTPALQQWMAEHQVGWPAA
jgi:hypothetical protein